MRACAHSLIVNFEIDLLSHTNFLNVYAIISQGYKQRGPENIAIIYTVVQRNLGKAKDEKLSSLITLFLNLINLILSPVPLMYRL